jgi:hypothetical protein
VAVYIILGHEGPSSVLHQNMAEPVPTTAANNIMGCEDKHNLMLQGNNEAYFLLMANSSTHRRASGSVSNVLVVSSTIFDSKRAVMETDIAQGRADRGKEGQINRMELVKIMCVDHVLYRLP